MLINCFNGFFKGFLNIVFQESPASLLSLCSFCMSFYNITIVLYGRSKVDVEIHVLCLETREYFLKIASLKLISLKSCAD